MLIIMYQNFMLNVELYNFLVQLTSVKSLVPVPGGDQQQHTDTIIDTSAWTSPVELLHIEWPLYAHALVTAYCCSSEGACSTHAGSENNILHSNTRKV